MTILKSWSITGDPLRGKRHRGALRDDRDFPVFAGPASWRRLDHHSILVPVPRQRNTREENAEIKAGRLPNGWDEYLDRLLQRDLMRAGLKRRVFIMTDIRTVSALVVVTLLYSEPLQDQRDGGNVESEKITKVVTCRRLRS